MVHSATETPLVRLSYSVKKRTMSGLQVSRRPRLQSLCCQRRPLLRRWNRTPAGRRVDPLRFPAQGLDLPLMRQAARVGPQRRPSSDCGRPPSQRCLRPF